MSDIDTDDDNVPEAGTTYNYKPSIAGAVWSLRLGPTALEWSAGYRAGRIGYDKITHIRMLYRPGSVYTRRFMTEIWGESSKVALASTTFTGILAQQAQDAEYSAFVVMLHRRIAAAGGRPVLNAGSPLLLYLPGAAIIGAAALGFIVVIGQTVFEGTGSNVLLLIAFAAFFTWQGAQFFWLNRPRRYRLDALPDDLLPKPRG